MLAPLLLPAFGLRAPNPTIMIFGLEQPRAQFPRIPSNSITMCPRLPGDA